MPKTQTTTDSSSDAKNSSEEPSLVVTTAESTKRGMSFGATTMRQYLRDAANASATQHMAAAALKWGGRALSAGVAAYKITEAEPGKKLEEAVHQGTMFTYGMVGGKLAASAAAGPCAATGLWYPACVGAAAFVGGGIGAAVGHKAFGMVKPSEGKESSSRPEATTSQCVASDISYTKTMRCDESSISYMENSITDRGINPCAVWQPVYSDNPIARDWDVTNAVESAVREESYSLLPSAYFAFMRASLGVGAGHTLSYAEFSQVARSTSLVESYNQFNPNARLRNVQEFHREVGGVASDVSIIKDLIDSEAHALGSEYVVCFPKSGVSTALYKQIARELEQVYFKHKTTPFFSLHFKNGGTLYPVIHPALHTLTGEVIALLDYWMKGFLNGGIFDEKFLKHWHELQTTDEQELRSRLIDLKAYCKEHCPDIAYVSLRELMNRYGVDHTNGASSAYQQPFMTSFRIIAYQEKVERFGNILKPTPAIRVEYSIDLMPDYEEFLESYCREHGEYPSDYQQIRQCYEQYAQEIAEKLPKMPFCQDSFALLGVINFYCYLYASLEKMGKEPDLAPFELDHTHHVPKAFPPIPVQYYKTREFEVSLQDIVQKAHEIHGEEKFDKELSTLFGEQNGAALPQSIITLLQTAITALIQEKLPDAAINAEEVNKMVRKTSHIFSLLRYRLGMESNILQGVIAQRFPKDAFSAFSSMALDKRLAALAQAVEKQRDEKISRWEKNPNLARKEIFAVIGTEVHQQLRAEYEKLDQDVGKAQQQLTAAVEQLKEEAEAAIKENQGQIEQDAKKQYAEEKKQIQAQKTKINQAIQQQTAEIAKANKQIAEAVSHRDSEIAKIPAGLRDLNKANIAAFRKPIDDAIASIKKEVTGMQAHVAHLKKARAEIDKAIQDGEKNLAAVIVEKKQRAADFINQQVETKTNALQKEQQSLSKEAVTASKEIAINCLTQIGEHDFKNIQRLQENTIHFSQVLLSISSEAVPNIADKYTYQLMGFTSQDIAKETGEQFKIVGGCGMSLPNLTTQPISQGEMFATAVADICENAEPEECRSFTWEDGEYSVVRFPVKPKPVYAHLVEQETPEALTILENLILRDELEHPPTLEQLTQALDDSGAALIHYAALMGHDEQLARLLGTEGLPALELPDALGHLPVHFAAKGSNCDTLSFIIKQNPSHLEVESQSGMTPLLFAAQHGHALAICTLIAAGADVNRDLPNGLFPLYLTIQNNYPHAALALIETAADLEVNKTIDSGMTALHLAVEYELTDVALALLARGAKGDIKRKSDGWTALHCAASCGNLEIFKRIVESGVAVDLPLESKKTPLHLAAIANDPEMVDYILSQAGNINEQDRDGLTPLMAAIQSGASAVALCLASVKDIAASNIVDTEGCTASMMALAYGMPEVADKLIAQGTRIDIKDDEGHDYLYSLVQYGEYSRLQSLIEQQGFDIASLRYGGKNLLEIAVQYKQVDIVYFLLEQGLRLTKNCTAYFSLGKGFRGPRHHDEFLAHFYVEVDEIGALKEHIASTNPQNKQMNALVVNAANVGSDRCLTFLLSLLSIQGLVRHNFLGKVIVSNNPDAVECILARWPDINQALDSEGNTPLHLSTQIGSRKVVEKLMEVGAQLKRYNDAGFTPLHVAVMQEDAYILKRLFKLSRPDDWPHELVVPEQKYPEKILKILSKYKVALRFADAEQVVAKGAASGSGDSNAIGDVVEHADILTKQLEQCLQFGDYVSAAQMLQEHPDLLDAFKSRRGGQLLQKLFSSISDYSELFASSAEQHEISAFLTPETLLSTLQEHRINPAEFLGKENVLMAVLSAESDKEACYRLDLLARYFSDALPILINDKLDGKLGFMQLALRLNKIELFQKMEVISAQRSEQFPQGHLIDALHEAVIANNYTLVKSLLGRYEVNAFNKKRQTPLMLAAAQGNTRMMSLLRHHGPLLELQDIEGRTALHYAMTSKKDSASIALLPEAHDCNAPDRRGITPLMLASFHGLLPAVRFICERGDYSGDFNALGQNALHMAAQQGQVKVIELLAYYGFDLDQVEVPSSPSKIARSQHKTALHIAAMAGKIDAVRRLLELGANPMVSDKHGRTLYEYAVVSKNQGMINFVQILLFGAENTDHKALIMVAAQTDALNTIDRLIIQGVEFNIVDKNGDTPIHYCARFNSINVARRLLSGGDCIVDLTNNQELTPLHLAAQHGHVTMLEYLLAAGASINKVTSNHHKTAIFMACSAGHSGAVHVLLKAGADYTMTNGQGLTPLHAALLHGHINIACDLALRGDSSWQSKETEQLSAEHRSKIIIHIDAFKEQYDLAKQAPVVGRLLLRHGLYATNRPEGVDAVSEVVSHRVGCS